MIHCFFCDYGVDGGEKEGQEGAVDLEGTPGCEFVLVRKPK